ncbi:MAG: FHA domain-containing protein [Myxococcales bacterium]|nr:FHA domain-containing protein [Myxococcales bacterium]
MATCPKCLRANLPAATTCAECGAPLAAPSDAVDLSATGVVCPACETYNEPDAKVCAGCGQDLAGLTGFLRLSGAADPSRSEITAVETSSTPRTRPELPASTLPSMPAADEPAEPVLLKPRSATAPLAAAAGAKPADAGCPYCGARLPPAASGCPVCGRRLTAATPEPQPASDVSVRLRLLRGYGREDATFPIGPVGLTLGREGSTISIPQDACLSSPHLMVRWQDGRPVLEDMQSRNGTFLRVRERADLRQGTEFICGTQRFRLIGLGGPTSDVRTPPSSDTRAYGGPVPRQLFVALRQLHRGPDGRGRQGMVILRCGPVVSLGQRGCAINFPEDALLSPRHLELHIRAAGVQLEDKSAGSGVFVRLNGPQPLLNGDEILAGSEVLRVEMA